MKVLVSEDIWDFNLDAALGDISEQRREQALKFKHEQGQRLCVLAYQLLKEGLQQEYGITGNPIFEYNEHGKPSIVGHPEIFFNLSHCKEAAICVVNDQPIGVDEYIFISTAPDTGADAKQIRTQVLVKGSFCLPP